MTTLLNASELGATQTTEDGTKQWWNGESWETANPILSLIFDVLKDLPHATFEANKTAYLTIMPEVNRQWRTLTAAQDKVQQLHGHMADAENAIYEINKRWDEEAESRGWCAESDDIKEEINQNIAARWRMPSRLKKFRVSTSIRSEIDTNHVVEIEATTEDAARQILEDNISLFISEEDILEEIASVGSIENWDVSDIYVEEA